MIRFILASQSPRRRELLTLTGYPFEVIVAGVDEDSVSDPHPGLNCVRTAQLKAHAVCQMTAPDYDKDALIIAADTAVSLEQNLLGKPKDDQDAAQMLTALRDRTHEVYTGVTVFARKNSAEVSGYHEAVVTMRNYNDMEIAQYIASNDPLDKAGAYGIQHPHFRPVAKLDGCFLGVMGLSICHLITLLDQLNIPRKVDFQTLEDAHQGYPCSILPELTRLPGK